MAVIGRLRPGVTADQARAELASRQVALSVGKWTWMTVLQQRVVPLPELVTREARSPVLVLLAGIGCVLLMVCANLANLLLVRASGRRREMQVRTAFGASMGQLLGQVTAESAMLVGLGGRGVALGRRGERARARPTWVSLARLGDVHVGWPAIAFAAASVRGHASSLAASRLLPLRRRDLMDGLRPHGGISDGSARGVRPASGAGRASRAGRRAGGRRRAAVSQPDRVDRRRSGLQPTRRDGDPRRSRRTPARLRLACHSSIRSSNASGPSPAWSLRR